jgi:MFS transporter, FHS family, glucose/mannose:H+ symporter
VLKPSLIRLPLYVGFAATGVGVALPGAILPTLLLAWRLRDEQAGLLFLLAWCGSSAGALLVQGRLRVALMWGCLLTASAALGLAWLPAAAAPLLMAVYGLGLGMAMTSISLIRQRTAPVRELELIRLNLMWAIGACACPSLAARTLINGSPRNLLACFAAFFVCLALWACFFEPGDIVLQAGGISAWRPFRIFRFVPLPLILMAFLVTGTEASAGGWLATYARRANHDLAVTIAAPTCLWAGLLLSRLFWSLPGTKLQPKTVVQGSLAVLAAAAILLVASGGGVGILLAAFGIGMGLGPVYPLLLANALKFEECGTIFFLAGLGSACLPWMTGVVSQQRDSLRQGLIVPMTASLLMLALALAFRWDNGPNAVTPSANPNGRP